MSLLTLFILFTLAFVVVVYALQIRSKVPKWFSPTGPLVLIRSQKGIKLVHRIADARERDWRIWGTIGVITGTVGMIVGAYLITQTAIQRLTQPQRTVISEPQNFVVVPGLNEFLPLSAAPEIALALALALIVHEGGHAIMCRVGDIDIRSTGLVLFTLLPIGAFVEPDEDSQNNASVAKRLRMFAAGVLNNFVFSLITIVILVGPVAMLITTAPGAAVGGVVSESPAAVSGIQPGDRVTSINGTTVSNNSELQSELSKQDSDVELTINENEKVTLERFVLVRGSSASFGISNGERITHIGGKPVSTVSDVYEELRQSENSTIQVQTDEKKKRVPIGALATVQPNGPFSESGLPSNETVIIQEIDGNKIYNATMLRNELSKKSPGDSVSVTVYTENGNQTEYNVTLGNNGGETFAGLHVSPGMSGMVLTDTGIRYYPAGEFLQFIKFDGSESPIDILFLPLAILVLPIASVTSVFGYNFSGFTPSVQSFYNVYGVPEAVEPVWFFFASTLYWSAWLGINIGIFNLLPTYALDGGHMLNAYIEGIFNKLNVDNHELEKVIGHTVKAGMLVILGILLFAPFIT